MGEYLSITKLNYGNSWFEYGKLPEEIQINESYEILWNMHPDNFHKIKVFGKTHDTPRWQQSYGKDYKFSGTICKSEPIPDIIQPFVDWANNKENNYITRFTFNQVLVNWYKNGKDHYIGWHSDDEKQLIPDSPVYGISLGIPRIFKIRSKNRVNKDDHSLYLDTNSYIIMGGEMQKYYQHTIPKSNKILQSRVSITLRCFE